MYVRDCASLLQYNAHYRSKKTNIYWAHHHRHDDAGGKKIILVSIEFLVYLVFFFQKKLWKYPKKSVQIDVWENFKVISYN